MENQFLQTEKMIQQHFPFGAPKAQKAIHLLEQAWALVFLQYHTPQVGVAAVEAATPSPISDLVLDTSIPPETQAQPSNVVAIKRKPRGKGKTKPKKKPSKK